MSGPWVVGQDLLAAYGVIVSGSPPRSRLPRMTKCLGLGLSGCRVVCSFDAER